MSRWEFSAGPDEPARADRPERSDDLPRGGARLAEHPDAGERQQAWEESRTHTAHAALDMLREKVPSAHDANRDADRRYAAEIPRLTHLWSEHEERWPACARDTVAHKPTTDAPNREPDPPGSYRSGGGNYLSPERNAECRDTISEVRETEPIVSADIQEVERGNTSGARLVGFQHRLKGDDRLREKVADQLAVRPDRTPAETTREIPDAIRYTFCVDQGSYVRGYHEIKERLESQGYEMYQSRNSWSDAEYKGVNTRWATPDGVRFEVQFHTMESFHAKHHMTHTAYERLRDPRTCDDERAELKAFQRDVSLSIPVPEGASGIPDYKKKGF